MRRRRIEGRPIEFVHEIPVEVHVVERVRFDGLQDDIRGGVGAEADLAATPFLLNLPRLIKASARAK